MSKQATPGPWRIGEGERALWVQPVGRAQEAVICDLINRDSAPSATEEDEANAALIAESPTLLLCAEELLRALVPCPEGARAERMDKMPTYIAVTSINPQQSGWEFLGAAPTREELEPLQPSPQPDIYAETRHRNFRIWSKTQAAQLVSRSWAETAARGINPAETW